MGQRGNAVVPGNKGLGSWRWPPSSLLGSLAEPALRHLLMPGITRQYRTGTVIIREGDSSTHVVVLLDGVVKATSVTLEGKEALLAIRVGGDLVGEFAAFDERPRSSTVTTCGVVVGRVIRQTEFLAALREDPVLDRAVNRSIVAKLRAANQHRVEFLSYDAPTRVARVLREIAIGYGDRSGNVIEIRWPLTQTELASLAIVAEPTVQKALRNLREHSVITTGYRTLTIADFAALDQIAGE